MITKQFIRQCDKCGKLLEINPKERKTKDLCAKCLSNKNERN